MAEFPTPASPTSLIRAGDTLHVEFAGADGFVWSYPARVIWTTPGRLALTLPAEPRWRPLLQTGQRLTATLVDGQTVASARLVVQGVSHDLPPLLLVGPPRPGRRRLVTTPLLPGAVPQLPANGGHRPAAH